MNRFLKILLVTVFFGTTSAQAQNFCEGLNLQVHGISKHSKSFVDNLQPATGERWRPNEKNLGWGLSCTNPGSDWSVGAYQNTFSAGDVNSGYLANNRYIRWGKTRHFDLGYTYGLVTGYPEFIKAPQIAGVALMGYLTAAIGHTRYGKINLLVFPGEVAALNLDVKLF